MDDSNRQSCPLHQTVDKFFIHLNFKIVSVKLRLEWTKLVRAVLLFAMYELEQFNYITNAG